MKKFEVKIYSCRCKESGVQFQLAGFAEEHYDSYGQKHFVTEIGEVAHINLLDKEGTSKEVREIENYFESKMKEVDFKSRANFGGMLRYLADPSVEGFQWYLDSMAFHKKCYQPDDYFCAEILNTEFIEQEAQPIFFKRWSSLNNTQKKQLVNNFFEENIDPNHPIMTDPYLNV